MKRINENGRSMVEMLGVLAIIGILSAVSLAGYSKAMAKHKVNQTINIVNGVIQRLMELDNQQLGTDFEIKNAESILNYHLLENCQEVTGSETQQSECLLPIGSLFVDVTLNSNNILEGAVMVTFSSANQCVAFSSVGWENAIPIDWMPADGEPFMRIGSEDFYEKSAINTTLIAQDCREGCEEGWACSTKIIIRSY